MKVWEYFVYRGKALGAAFALVSVFLLFGVSVDVAEAVNIHSYSDTLSDASPGQYSNHQIDFRIKTAIPPNGFVRFIPEQGAFNIPSTNFDIDNVDLYVSTSSGYIRRSAAAAPSATDDGISITTGSSGNIEITLNSTVGIPAEALVRMVIASTTVNGTSTDVSISNPASVGSYIYTIEIGGGTFGSATGTLALVNPVGVGPSDTRETIPPFRFNGAPTGTLSGTSQSVEISLETDEFARCRYSTASGTAYFSMATEFETTFVTVHTADVDVATNTSYTFYVRCIDDEGNFNIDDFVISFTVPEFPEGTPGPPGSEEGEGAGVGDGSGTADPGAGDPSGGDDSSGGTSGGGGGGGGGGGSGPSSGGSGGGGGFEGTNRPYQSGDGRVIINGYAFPGSDIVVLVDGAIAERDDANNNGAFSVIIDEIARGVYTFGVYAIDRNGTRSTTFSTTFTVTGGRGSTLSNVNIMPSIVVDPDPVDPGQTVTFSGYSIPDATVTIENQSDRTSVGLQTFTTTSASDGFWTIDVSTTGFTRGTYKVRAKAKQDDGVSTNYSDFTYYGVGEEAQAPQTSDLNRDGFVNLIDFSILLFWWNSDGGNSDPPADINRDGRVSLTDFSIMIFNWTG